MGQMTRLEAVNQALLAAGEAIVSDLENQSGVDTSIAEYLLDQYAQDFQLRGLANNEYCSELAIDAATNKIFLPQNTMSIDFDTLLTNTDGEVIRVSVKTDGQSFVLWNVTDQTSDWSAYATETIKVKLLVKLSWEDIDTPGQRAITASAARRYQMLTQGDEGMDAYLQQDEAIYNMMGKSRDINSKRRTIWDAADYSKKRSVFRPNGGNPDFRQWRGRTS